MTDPSNTNDIEIASIVFAREFSQYTKDIFRVVIDFNVIVPHSVLSYGLLFYDKMFRSGDYESMVHVKHVKGGYGHLLEFPVISTLSFYATHYHGITANMIDGLSTDVATLVNKVISDSPIPAAVTSLDLSLKDVIEDVNALNTNTISKPADWSSNDTLSQYVYRNSGNGSGSTAQTPLIRKYPPIPLGDGDGTKHQASQTFQVTGQNYGNGTYKLEASSTLQFNDPSHDISGIFNDGDVASYTGFRTHHYALNQTTNQWLIVRFPYPIKLSNYKIMNRNINEAETDGYIRNAPRDW
eukprot:CAMPEP_0197574908 /NCGR_PEP_ID=MMETSP1326-20131121/489_1 /TAXON_ID=1155430 /ORGANISM="Genus nov. species nov., Strain RCC2288" /LENGTH=296 /DNA_ID=CAMNT_0043137573 /DNA_START=242 /DNA_END=1129 /DNA_ORIENTATION=-